MIAEQMKKLDVLSNQAYDIYLPIVNDLCTETVTQGELEYYLDNLLNYCYDKNMLILLKRICKHYLYLYPKTIQFYIHSYKKMWDS